MRFTRLSEGSISGRFDDAGAVFIPRGRPPGSHHFVALYRGCVVIIALGLPIGLSIFGIAPPTDEFEITAKAMGRPKAAYHDPFSTAILPRSGAEG